LQRELDGLVYRNPQAEWETADRYLSGDVRVKLKTAEAAATLDPSYRRNVEALKEVQPVDLLPGDISARLGSSWIPTSDLKKFVAELLDISEGAITVSHSGAITTWALTLESYAKCNASNTTAWGTLVLVGPMPRSSFRAGFIVLQSGGGAEPRVLGL
jgi:N12 class adenine-specific DNA methylase